MDSKLRKEKILYDIRDMAEMLNVGENAIRNHVFRRTGLLPSPIRTQSRKLYWTYEQLVEHFRAITPLPSPPPAEKKIGRPTKRQALAKAQMEAGG